MRLFAITLAALSAVALGACKVQGDVTNGNSEKKDAPAVTEPAPAPATAPAK